MEETSQTTKQPKQKQNCRREKYQLAMLLNLEIINCYITFLERIKSGIWRKDLSPWFESNKIIHGDLKIHYVSKEIVKFATRYLLKLEDHTNQLAIWINQSN